MNAVTQQRDIEVDQKAQLPTTQARVGKKLRVMNRRRRLTVLSSTTTISATIKSTR